MSSCNCNYSVNVGANVRCGSCVASSDVALVTQKRLWKQVRVPTSLYTTNLSAFTGAYSRMKSGTSVNWHQMSDRSVAAKQVVITPTRGNSLRASLTSDRPGAGSPGGTGVDLKHDSYSRYLNRKKARNLKTQTQLVTPVKGNKTRAIGIIENNSTCCSS